LQRDETFANDGARLALLKKIAAEFDLAFPTLQDARRFQAEEINRSRHFGQNVVFQIYALSNGLTDELVQRLRRAVARLIHR
jgi:CHASE3 domain sensor protein